MDNSKNNIAWKQIEERVIFRNQYVGLRNDLVQLPNGGIVEHAVIEGRDAVIVVCLNETNKLVLVRQFRYPWFANSWELVAGLIEQGELPKDAAIREIEEETGCKVNNIHFLKKFRPSATSTAWGYLFIAEVQAGGSQSLDPTEFIEMSEFFPEEVEELIEIGEIVHGPTLLGLLIAKSRGFYSSQ